VPALRASGYQRLEFPALTDGAIDWWSFGPKIMLPAETETTSDRANGLTAVGKTILVRACKYDGSEHRSWLAHVFRQEGSLIVLDAKFINEVVHDLLGTIAGGTHSLEYYWLDRWYNVFRFAHPNGELRNYYCNVNVPPTFDGEILSYVDLDLDILVEPDFSYQILDVEDFQTNAQRYGYSAELQTNARRAVDELVRMIQTREFPFGSEKQ